MDNIAEQFYSVHFIHTVIILVIFHEVSEFYAHNV